MKTLEARLRRTEALLQNVLHFVSDEQLSFVLRDDGPLGPVEEAAQVETERADPALWRLYPLASAMDVRAWQNDERIPRTTTSVANTTAGRVRGESQSSPELPDLQRRRRSGRDRFRLVDEPMEYPMETTIRYDKNAGMIPSPYPNECPTLEPEGTETQDSGTLIMSSGGSMDLDGASIGSFVPMSFQKEFLW